MSVSLENILPDVNDKVRNTTSGSLSNEIRTRAINRIFDNLRTFADWIFSRRTKTFYFIDGVSEYNLKDYVGCTCLDIDGATPILDFKNPYDLRPVLTGDKSLDYLESRAVRQNIRRNKRVSEYSVENNTLILNYFRQVSAQLHNCDSLTANGAVTASGNATNLTVDEVVFDEGSGALNFDVSAGTSLIVTFTGITAKDLTQLKNKSHLILKQWLPTITNFTSIELRWGSDATNYYSKTETAPAGNAALKAGKNIFAFRWADATEVLDPDDSAINYLQVRITYGSAVTDTDFRIDDIRIGGEVEMEIEYYSKAMVQTSTGAYQLAFNPDDVTMSDVLLGDDVQKNTIVEGATYELFQRIGGESERDQTDAFAKYDTERQRLFEAAGVRIRRQSKVLNFPSRHGGRRG